MKNVRTFIQIKPIGNLRDWEEIPVLVGHFTSQKAAALWAQQTTHVLTCNIRLSYPDKNDLLTFATKLQGHYYSIS